VTLTLEHTSFGSDGIFGTLWDDLGEPMAATCEHAYSDDDVKWLPKIPNGVYDCVRGMHRLRFNSQPFETFEITKVPKHAGILFHIGNDNEDSSGCVLLGVKVITQSTCGRKAISDSAYAFGKFMNSMKGINSFKLVVK
jgi:hypothetical protein